MKLEKVFIEVYIDNRSIFVIVYYEWVHCRPLQPSPIFAGKDRSLPNRGAPHGKTLVLLANVSGSDKHSRLLGPFLNYACKKINRIGF